MRGRERERVKSWMKRDPALTLGEKQKNAKKKEGRNFKIVHLA